MDAPEVDGNIFCEKPGPGTPFEAGKFVTVRIKDTHEYDLKVELVEPLPV